MPQSGRLDAGESTNCGSRGTAPTRACGRVSSYNFRRFYTLFSSAFICEICVQKDWSANQVLG